jgi:hypothetical protein
MNATLSACNAPTDQAVVKGVLAAIFTAAGPSFAAKKLEEKLAEQDACDVSKLVTLTVDKLIKYFGMTYGEAETVDEGIFPKEDQVVPFVQVIAQGLGGAPALGAAAGSRTAPEFPALGSDGLPSARDMRGWLPGFRTHLAGRVSVAALAEYDALAKDAKHELPALYLSGATADSEAVMTALLTAGTKGLPTGIVLSFQASVIEHRQGLVALKDLLSRVFTVSDVSLGVLLAWFQKPDQVLQAWLLGLALTKWLEVRGQLTADGLAQSDIACRLSLLAMCGKLVELKAGFAVLDAIHPDGIPVQVLIDTVRKKANSFSSIRSATEEVSVLAEGYTLVAHHDP